MENEEIDLEEQVQNKKCGCSHKKKERSKGEAKKLINRLNISALVWQKTSGREKMRRSMNLW